MVVGTGVFKGTHVSVGKFGSSGGVSERCLSARGGMEWGGGAEE